jgi:hypothetical protein
LGLKPERIIQVCVTAKEDEIDAEKKKNLSEKVAPKERRLDEANSCWTPTIFC